MTTTREKPTDGHESGHLLAVLDELNTNAFADSRVWLFCFYTDFLEHDALCVGRSSSRGGFVNIAQRTLLVRFIGLSIII